jgi:hypothetical protein
MSIRLTVEANDPEVESLLEYLDANVKNSAGYKIFLLERAVQWLRPTFTLSGSDSLANASIVVEHPNTLSEQHSGLSADLAIGR